MIEVKSVTKEYAGTVVLDIPHLEIPRKECFGLVGNNGAGKTTLFRIILDLIRATTGYVTIEENIVSRSEEWKSHVGSYLDEHMLLHYLTPDEYFETLRKIYVLSEQDIDDHLDSFEEFFNGEIRGSDKYIRDLSKGNIKKVGIASALLANPNVVLLDEPFENLDPSSQIKLKKIILKAKEEQNITFLISSHDLDQVTEISDRIVLLEKGKIIKDLKDTPELMDRELKNYFAA